MHSLRTITDRWWKMSGWGKKGKSWNWIKNVALKCLNVYISCIIWLLSLLSHACRLCASSSSSLHLPKELRYLNQYRLTHAHVALSFRSWSDDYSVVHLGHGLDLANGRDEDKLEDEEGEETGGDDGKQELLQAGEDFTSSAWLFEDLFLDRHEAIVLDSRHFLLDFSLFMIINSKDSLYLKGQKQLTGSQNYFKRA